MTASQRLQNANTAMQRKARAELARNGITSMANRLTATEEQELHGHEEVIENGLNVWYQVGEALLNIRDKRLYRSQYSTFEEYCRERWGMRRDYANKLISASEVMSNLNTNVSILPANEAQVRPLTSLEADDQRILWPQIAEEADGHPTGKQAQEAVKAFKSSPEYVQGLVRGGDIGIKQIEPLNEALKGLHPDVLAVIERWHVIDTGTIPLLAHLHSKGRATFEEVATGGYIQITDDNDRVPVTAPSAMLYDAVARKSKIHKQIAVDTRNATLDQAADAVSAVTPFPASRTYTAGEIVTVGRHTLICADNRDVADYLTRLNADFVFADPPYNAHAADYDDGSFVWDQDFLINCAPIVAVTPGISSIQDFMRRTDMPYKWSTSCYINNGMTRGALGFGNWIYTALFSHDSLHRNAQDVVTISISSADKDDTSAKRQKPPRYLAWLFNLLVPKGGLVIDAFGGSGIAVLVAEQLGLRCVAVEKDPETFAAMVARVERGVLDGNAV